jgi:dihydroxyacetone kinase
MTRILNDPHSFADEALAGFVAANKQYVRRIDGGVVRSTHIPTGQVGLVVGGGSGHYPAFAGLVGAGLASGSACGNMFASPSAGHVYRVARSVDRGAGVILSFGNYAGDVLNFGQAEKQLRDEGIDVRTVIVTDDIASGSIDELHKRRGIAGDLTVFKIAGAAAEAGYSLDATEEVARRANYRTRSLGVAFTGCTLPGASTPLFSIEAGMMAVGLGIHGEPGISEEPIPTARDLAALLVGKLLAEKPPEATDRVVPILNGLGAVKYDELFVLYAAVSELLTDAGLTVVAPECGELVTSLDMAGVSLTLFWVDTELEDLWDHPADAPAFRKGSIRAEADDSLHEDDALVTAAVSEGAEQHAAAPLALELITLVRDTLVAHEEALGRLDAIAGDGDHGIGMVAGAQGAVAAAALALEAGAGVGQVLEAAGTAWAESAGGTSGALWGVTWRAVGSTLGAAGHLDRVTLVQSAAAGLNAMTGLGGATVGDKTIIDAFAPFVAALENGLEGGALNNADSADRLWQEAASVATAAAAATADLRPRLGRARPLAEKSFGHPDAGATSFALIATAIGASISHTLNTEGSLR